MVYISGLSLIFVNHLHISESAFPYYQGAVLLAFAAISMACGRIIHFLGMKKGLTLQHYYHGYWRYFIIVHRVIFR